jgi:tetratricopeptide (TPR) repeat protein
MIKRRLATLLACLATVGCATRATKPAESPLIELRESAPSSANSEVVARWLLAELISPGGEAKHAVRARKRLDELGATSLHAALARGLDDSLHGRMKSAPDHFLQAAQAARKSTDPHAELLSWFAVHQAIALRNNAPDLWLRWKPFVVEGMRTPLRLGWRARSELVDWWSDEEHANAVRDVEKLAAAEFGCLDQVRIAGPFGRQAAADAYRSFAAEAPGPWPAVWPKEHGRGDHARVLETERRGCFVSASDPPSAGVYYVETYLDLPEAKEVILAVQGAIAIWVDDHRVLDRDPRSWGVWPKFGTQVWLEGGRHRVLAKLANPSTSVRALLPDGRPAALASSPDAAAPYMLAAPKKTADANVLDGFVTAKGVVAPKDDLLRYAAAYLAGVEGQGDIASLLHEPLIAKLDAATGPALAVAASYAEIDPLFDERQVKDLGRQLHDRAVKKDPRLWRSRLALALSQAEQSGPAEAVAHARALADKFPEAPGALIALARLYGELGWNAEYSRAILELERRFPRDVEALHLAVEVHDAQGRRDHAERLVKRIHELDPDNEIVLTRALSRQDYGTALAELERIGKRRPDRKEITERLYDVMVRAGNTSDSWKKLQAAIEKQPRDARARLALADAQYSTGQQDALRRALADAVESGAPTETLKDALELVEGMSELEPYRIDARTVIAEWEKSGQQMPGTAARILDYAAVWAHSDGSSRMLEHEVVRLQSAEAISRFAEHPKVNGLVLHLRVIKKDGRVLEPEEVAGKPTVTFPHLEIGDYIETEHVISRPGDGQQGSEYVGPHWFFREENIAYARSELVVAAPKHKALIIETRGNVPPPSVREEGGVVVRRWRVDSSPAAPSEPGSAPASEFLPSVRVAWGVSLDRRLDGLSDNVAEATPIDPRVVRIANKIVEGVRRDQPLERARRLYRWVLDNVEHGEQTDGRRVVVSKNGNRWRAFMTLARCIDLNVRYAVAKNRLMSPPIGAISAATVFNEPLLRVDAARGRAVWLTFEPPVDGNPASAKNLPFGYVPADVRGSAAYLLGETKRELVSIPTGGAPDGISFEGRAKLAVDGSAIIELSQSFSGKYAMQLRTGLAQLPGDQLRDVVESRLLGQSLRGARLLDYRIEHRDDVDRPLVLHMRASMAGFAQVEPNGLVIIPPFAPRISSLARLPERQTPLLIGSATHQQVRLTIELPKGSTVTTPVQSGRVTDGERSVLIEDRVRPAVVELVRTIELPAGRVQPQQYGSFVAFARRADDALNHSLRVRVGSGGT